MIFYMRQNCLFEVKEKATSPEHPEWYFVLHNSLKYRQDVDVAIGIAVIQDTGT
jgi:hypothetical protein